MWVAIPADAGAAAPSVPSVVSEAAVVFETSPDAVALATAGAFATAGDAGTAAVSADGAKSADATNLAHAAAYP